MQLDDLIDLLPSVLARMGGDPDVDSGTRGTRLPGPEGTRPLEGDGSLGTRCDRVALSSADCYHLFHQDNRTQADSHISEQSCS
jgi:hypothetical protein